MRRVILGLAIAVLLLVGAGLAMADTVPFTAATINPSNWNSRVGGYDFGLTFIANTSFKVDALGSYWKAGATGTETVGLYKVISPTVGSLVVSTTLTVNNAPSNGYYFQSIAPTPLTAGTKYMVVVYVPSRYSWAFVDQPSGAPTDVDPAQVTFVDDIAWLSGTTGLVYPTTKNNDPRAGYYGPNFKILVPSTVPEPGFLLLLGLGIGIIALLAWRTKA